MKIVYVCGIASKYNLIVFYMGEIGSVFPEAVD